MVEDLGAFTLLGESADWLKDSKGRSVGDHRVAALAAYREAWASPADKELHKALRQALLRLLRALRQNHLYPDDLTLGHTRRGSPKLLADPSQLRDDFEKLCHFCVINKFGMGEIHLMYFVYALCGMLFQPDRWPYDFVIEKRLGDILFLREPLYRADNLSPFSLEVKTRFHAARLMRVMRRFGLFGDAPVDKLSADDRAEARALLKDPLGPAAAMYVSKPLRFAFAIFDTSHMLQEYVRARAAKEALADERSPEELFAGLHHRLRRLKGRAGVGPVLRKRLLNLGIMAIVRTMAYVDPVLGRKMYIFLRSERDKPGLRHDRMFQVLPNDAHRLRLVNFLYAHGTQNPMYYIDRFGRHFRKGELQFVSKEVGFTFEHSPTAE